MAILANFNVPGVYISEGTAGAIPAPLSDYDAVYILGHSTKVTAPKGEATFISNRDDFFNTFSPSQSTPIVDLYFAQLPNKGFYFINVPPKATSSFEVVGVPAEGDEYSIAFDLLDVSYTAIAADTAATVKTKLAERINSTASHIARVSNGIIRTAPDIVVTPSANLTVTVVNGAPTYPKAADVIDVMEAALDSDFRQGCIIASEFFQRLTDPTEHSVLALAAEAIARDPLRFWDVIVDCSQSAATSATGAGAINTAKSERALLASPQGHSAYYFPYLIDAQDRLVPPAAAIAGLRLRRWAQQGIQEPPAGVSFPIYGTKGTSFKITRQIQEQLHPLGINCIRVLPNRGTVAYSARTLSTSPYYRFTTTRAILNVLAGTLRGAFDSLLFTTVDGYDLLFDRIRQTAIMICESFRSAGALYGSTPEEAYLVICDRTNQDPLALEAGKIRLDVYVKPSPMMESLDINLLRVPVGSVIVDLVNGTASIEDPANPATQQGNSNTAPAAQ